MCGVKYPSLQSLFPYSFSCASLIVNNPRVLLVCLDNLNF